MATTIATYWQRGEVIDYTNSTGNAIAAGEVLSFGEACGVAAADIPVGATGAVHIEGVFKIPKTDGEIEMGVRVCLKDGKAQKHTPESDSDCKWLGHTIAKAEATDDYALVKINV